MSPVEAPLIPELARYDARIGRFTIDDIKPAACIDAQRCRRAIVLVATLLVASAQVTAGCSSGMGPSVPREPFPSTGCPESGPPAAADVRARSADEGVPGTYVVTAKDSGRVITQGCPDYRSFPPAAGPMSDHVANCGDYDEPIPPANAVRSLAIGAVWISYSPDLDARSRKVIRRNATTSSHVLAAPMEGLPSPIVLTAWQRQLQLDSVDDPRFDDFVNAYLFAPDQPLGNATCDDGVGRPAASRADTVVRR